MFGDEIEVQARRQARSLIIILRFNHTSKYLRRLISVFSSENHDDINNRETPALFMVANAFLQLSFGDVKEIDNGSSHGKDW